MKKTIFVLALLVLVSCSQQNMPTEENAALYELTDEDIFTRLSEENFTSMDVSIEGVVLGDSRRIVVDELGSPDNFTRFEGEGLVIENLEYGEVFGLENTGLIYHLENDEVTRITINDEFNEYLQGETVINSSKEDIYFLLGTPDGTQILYKYILLNYNSKGFQFVTFRGDEIAFSLVVPGETIRTVNTSIEGEKVYIPYSDEIVFT